MIALVTAALLCACGGDPPATDAQRQERIASMYASYRVDFPTVSGIAAAELADRLDRPDAPVLVDVRPVAERGVSIIPGALSRKAFEADPERFRGREIVAYCTIGARSGEFASEMGEQGLTVRNLEGGVLAWTHAGGSLIDPTGEETRRVHVYGERWNLAAKGYDAVLTDASGAEAPSDGER